MNGTTMTPAELLELADLVADRLADRLRRSPLLITKEELSERTTLSLSTIERRVKDGTLPAVKTGHRVLISPDAVIESLTRSEPASVKTTTGAEP
jgi:excisionase family DNA binding protein